MKSIAIVVTQEYWYRL